MRLLHLKTGEELEAEISKVETTELAEIDASARFSFEWKRERQNEVFKITLKGEEEVLGLVSVIDVPRELRLHVNLLELLPEQVGKEKEIDWIAGCLLAYVADHAFQKGYEGFVSLEPKTVLVQVYVEKYGFAPLGLFYHIHESASKNLIRKYL